MATLKLAQKHSEKKFAQDIETKILTLYRQTLHNNNDASFNSISSTKNQKYINMMNCTWDQETVRCVLKKLGWKVGSILIDRKVKSKGKETCYGFQLVLETMIFPH